MLEDRLSPADASAREKEMRDALAACPRILDLVARGPLADAEAVVYLRSPLDPDPVVVSNDLLMGCTKAAEIFFRSQGVGKDDPVAVLLPICPATIAAIWGAAACGIAEPINLLFTREAIIAQLNAVKAKLLLAPPPGMPGGLYEKIEDLQKDVPSLKRIVVVPLDGTISFDGDVLKPDPAWRDDYGQSRDAAEADRVAVMLPTGGTTGHPKVARLTHRAMVASSVSSRMALDYRKGDRAMISLPLFHVGGLFVGVGACLSAGVTIVIPGPAGSRDPALVKNFWKVIEKHRLTHAGNVPTTLGALADIEVGDCDISTLRVTPTGASICPPEIERRYLARSGAPCVQQVYGMTELAGAITHDVVGVKPRPESVGIQNPLVELAILAGDQLHTGPWPSPVGELLTRGPQVFPGYVDKKQTEDAFYQGMAAHRRYLPHRRRRLRLHHGPRQGRDHQGRTQYRPAGDRGCRAAISGCRARRRGGPPRRLCRRGADAVRLGAARRPCRPTGAFRLRAGQHPGTAGAAAGGFRDRRNAGHAGRKDLQTKAPGDRGKRSRPRIAGGGRFGERGQRRGDHRSLPWTRSARQDLTREGGDG
jgi:fatty-acyl-CoA synthase